MEGVDSVLGRIYEKATCVAALRLQRGECPECGAILDHSEGCQLCRACGWSGCES